jgi:hypothetical protein
MRQADASATAPRLALPSWRIAREATLSELCTAFVDRSKAEGPRASDRALLPSGLQSLAPILRSARPHRPTGHLT